MTEDEVLPMDESILGDLDEMSLPELPDSVWMRLLANALDPDAPPTSFDLIPVDEPGAVTPDDDGAMLGDDRASDATEDLPTSDDGLDDSSDPWHPPSHDDLGGHDQYGHGVHDGGESSDSGFSGHPWRDSDDDPTTGGF